jgi:tetratricopeptide (TPR) repeat protein
LTGRGLIHFQLGAPGVDADLKAALAIFREHGDVASMALSYSFYAEVAAARGEIGEGRRRRLEVLEFYLGLPDDVFVLAARAYSRAKLGVLDGDLTQAERYYREAAAGYGQIDRPMMRSICLGMVADFDERAGNYAAAINDLDEAVETNDALGLRGFTGALLARLAWVLLQNGDTARAEFNYNRALDLARRLNNTPVAFMALTGLAELHRLHGRNGEAAAAATEALDLYLAGSPRRLSNRIDARSDVLAAGAVCCTVLGVLAAEGCNGEQAAQLLGHADRLRQDAGAPVPTFQRDDLDRARKAAVTLLGHDAFLAEFELGQRGRLGHEVTFRP